MADGVLDTLVVKLRAEMDTLRNDLRGAQQETAKAGEAAGQAFGRSFEGSSGGGVGGSVDAQKGKLTNDAQQSGTAAGRAFGAAFRVQVSEAAQESSKVLAGILATVGVAAGTAGLGLVKLAGEAEQAQVAFTTLLGSAEKAQAFLGQLRDFAARTPFEMAGLQDSSRKLLAFGFTAQQIIPMLTAVGDAVGSLGGSAEVMDRVVYALGQMQAKGKVSAEEMMQLAETGIPVWKMLADEIGVSIPEAMKMAEKGAISAGQAIPAILEGMQKKFGGGMVQQSQTLLGMWSTTMDNLKTAGVQAGEAITEALNLKDVLSGVNEALGRLPAILQGLDLKRWAQDNGAAIAALGGAITAALIPAAVAGATALAGFIAPLLPFMAAGAAIALTLRAMGVGMDDVRRGFDQAKQALAPFADAMNAAGQEAQGRLMPILRTLGEGAQAGFEAVRDVVERVFMPALASLAPYAQQIGAQLGPLFSNMADAIRAAFELARDAVNTVFIPAFQAIWPVLQPILATVLKGVEAALALISGAWRTVTQVLTGDWAGAWKTIVDSVAGFGVRIEAALDALAPKLGEAGKKLGSYIWNGLQGSFDGLQALFLDAIANAIEALKDQLPGFLQGIAGRLVGGAREAANENRADAQANLNTAANVDFTPSPPRGAPTNGFTASKGQAIRAAAQLLGIDPNDLAAVISFETGGTFRQDIRNPTSSATGLIQFMEATAKQLGTSTAELARMSFEEQMKYVVKYLQGRGITNGSTLGDVYSAVAGWGYRRGTEAYRLNQVWDADKDGYIGKGEAVTAGPFQAHRRNYFPDQGGTLAYANARIPYPTNAPTPTNTPAKTGYDYAALFNSANAAAPTAEEQKKYNLTLQDWNKHKAQAIKLEQLHAEAIAKGDDAARLSIEARMRAWAKEDKAKLASLQFAREVYARERAEAAKNDQPARTQAEIRAQEKLEKQLRSTSRARLEQLAGGTVGENGFTLDKWKGARAEIERRDRAADQSRAKDKAEDEKAAKEAEARAKEAAQRRARVAEQARQGDITLARQEAGRLDQMRENDLRKAGDSAAKRREVELRYANDIYLAKKAIAEREYADAMRDAANGPAQNRAQDELIAKQNLDAALGKAEAEKNGRLIAARKAEEAEDKAASDRAAAREKEQAQLRARIADERRQLTESAARQELERTQELNRQELAAFRGTGAQRLDLIRRQAEDEYQARLAVARATRDRLLRESANQGGSNQGERDRQINAAYGLADTTARGTRDAAVRQATEQQAESVRKLRDEYSKLADQMRQGIASGKVSAADFDTWNKALDDLATRTDAAGLSQNRFITGARQNTEALYQQGVDAAIASGAFDDLTDSHDRAAQAQGKVTVSIQDAIANMPQGEEALATYVAALAELEDQGVAAAGSVRAVLDEIDHLRQLDEGERAGNAALETLDQIAMGGRDLLLTAEKLPDAERNFSELFDRLIELRGELGTPGVADAWGESIEELGRRGELTAAQVRILKEAIVDLSALPDPQLPDNLQGRGAVNNPAVDDASRGVLADGEAERLAAAFWGQPLEELKAAFASLSQKDTPLGNLLTGAIQAQELLSRLEIAADPVEIQGITAKIAEFMASDMGKALPPTISGALEAGVKDADNYREILASATAEGIRDGFDRAADAGTGPQNRFAEFSETLWGMGDALKDPVNLEAVTGELERARAAGELTNTELALLKQIIDSINGTPIEIGLSDDERRFEQISAQADRIVADFEAGATSAEEFASQLGPVTAQMERMAAMAEAQGKTDIAAMYRDIAVALRNMIPVLAGSTEKLEHWGSTAEQIEAVAEGFRLMGDAVGGDLGANLTGIGNALSLALDVGKDIASGNYLAAAVKVISSLINAFGAFNKAKREALKQQKQFNEQFTFLSGDDYAKTFVRSRGFFADFFGGGPEVKQEVDKVGLLFAKSLEGGFVNGLKGMGEALAQNDFSVFQKTLRESVFGGLKEGMADAFFNNELMKGIIAPAIKAWADAMKTAGTEDDAAALGGIRAAMGQAEALGKAYFDQVAPMLSGLGQEWGIGQNAPTGSIAALQGEISKLQQQLSVATSDAERASLRQQVAEKEKELERLNGQQKEQAASREGELSRLRYELESAKAALGRTTDQAERERLASVIADLSGRIGVLNYGDFGGAAPLTLTPANLTQAGELSLQPLIPAFETFNLRGIPAFEALSLKTVPEFGGHVGQFGVHIGTFGSIAARMDTAVHLLIQYAGQQATGPRPFTPIPR